MKDYPLKLHPEPSFRSHPPNPYSSLCLRASAVEFLCLIKVEEPMGADE